MFFSESTQQLFLDKPEDPELDAVEVGLDNGLKIAKMIGCGSRVTIDNLDGELVLIATEPPPSPFHHLKDGVWVSSRTDTEVWSMVKSLRAELLTKNFNFQGNTFRVPVDIDTLLSYSYAGVTRQWVTVENNSVKMTPAKVKELAKAYADYCDKVMAWSQSLRDVIFESENPGDIDITPPDFSTSEEVKNDS